MKLLYKVDGIETPINVDDATSFFFGSPDLLYKEFHDITSNFDWHHQGYSIQKCEKYFDANTVSKSIERLLFKLVEPFNNADMSLFKIEKYHRFVTDAQHLQVINQTRQLTPTDLGFPAEEFLSKVSDEFGIRLNWNNGGPYDPKIIVRINKPNSTNFNPPHKDIYQVYEMTGSIPPMVNIWVPICGVGGRTGLPVAAGSHLLPENLILRSEIGAKMFGQKYNVNCIESWGGDNELQTLVPNSGEMIMFSSHLIHGLAQNFNDDVTRISLEFRLFG